MINNRGVFMSEIFDQEKTKKLDELKELVVAEKKQAPEIKAAGKEPKIKKQCFKKIKKFWQSLSKKKKVMLISGVVLLLIVIAGVTFWLLKHFAPEAKKTATPSKIVINDNYSYKDGKLIFVSNNKEIGTYNCENKAEKLCYVAYLDNEDDFDKPKLLAEDGQEIKLRSKIYFDNYVFIYDNKTAESGVVILYNIKTKKTIGYYQLIKAYNSLIQDYVIAKDSEGKYGMLEISATEVKTKITFTNDYLGIIENQDAKTNYVIAKKSNKWYLANYNGSLSAVAFKNQIVGYNDTYVKLKDASGRYTITDHTAKELAKDNKYIYLCGPYFLIVNDQNRLLARDINNTKLNEEGIILLNTTYNPEITYDEDGVEISKKYAAIITLGEENNRLTVAVNESKEQDKVYNINLQEGSFAKALAYYSYFGGKLYFYEDLAKEILIGSYPCTNPNQDLASGLKNCLPASDTVYENNELETNQNRQAMIPIINQRFVFIYDTPSGASSSQTVIKLYDLMNKKVLGTYLSVNTYTAANSGVLNHVTSDDLQVVAKNKSNKMGMLSIDQDGVAVIYDFNYTSMEKLGKYMLVQTTDNKWKLLSDNLISTITYDGKIVNYTDLYLKVKKSNRYYVYDYQGNQVLDFSHIYVDLYDDYVAVVDEPNSLTLYDYQNQNVINNVKLPLTTKDYANLDKPPYKISFTSNQATISIYDGTNYVDHQFDLTTGTELN